MNPTADVATFLGGAGLGLTVGTNLFASLEKAEGMGIPKDAVFVFGGMGGRPDRCNNPKVEDRMPMVNIRVRNCTTTAGETLARNIMDALQGAEISGYDDVRALQSEPGAALEDETGLVRMSMTFELVYRSDLR